MMEARKIAPGLFILWSGICRRQAGATIVRIIRRIINMGI